MLLEMKIKLCISFITIFIEMKIKKSKYIIYNDFTI
jgi:hypothetical protein